MSARRRPPASQPWIHSAPLDTALILLPPFLAVAFVLLFREAFDRTANVPLWAWVAFILCIDVAHVYSTIFRTYLNRAEFGEHKTLLTAVPLACWLAGALLYSTDAALFWRVLAYAAVFHFVRQQYGFMMLYSRRESGAQRRYKWIDKGVIYLATIYPLVYWHTHLPRNFHWLVDGDFIAGVPPAFAAVTGAAYGLFALAYVVKEWVSFTRTRETNLPKHALVAGTATAWYVGIVALDGDMAFTVTNVVSHGIPYMALIWVYGRRQALRLPGQGVLGRLKLRHVFSPRFLPLFVGSLLILAYLEEGLWDGLVWREHLSLFSGFAALPKIDDPATLSWLVPLLVLPQATHYVLDAFIWRLRGPTSGWRRIVFQHDGGQAG